MAGVPGGLAGGETTGIGILGMTPSRLSREMDFSIARSAGDSIHPSGWVRRRFTDTDMGIDSDMETIITTLVRTTMTGAVALTTSQIAITPMGFIEARDLLGRVFIPGLVRQWVRVDS